MMFAGQMGCEALNFGLKRIIKGERPQRRFPRVLLLVCPESLGFLKSDAEEAGRKVFRRRGIVCKRGCRAGLARAPWLTMLVWSEAMCLPYKKWAELVHELTH